MLYVDSIRTLTTTPGFIDYDLVPDTIVIHYSKWTWDIQEIKYL